jgi:2-methylcitrate dehydratase PrpD
MTATTQSHVEALAGYISNLGYDDLPAEVVDRAKQVILDCIGAMYSGAPLLPRRGLEDYVEMLAREDGPCSLVGSDRRGDVLLASFANSIAAHADETDDAHYATLTHPSMVVVPVALALGEAQHLSGMEMITAVTAGYDVQCRVALALIPQEMMKRGFMPLSVCANFGSVATAGLMLGLDADEARHALGLTGVTAGGLWAVAEDGTHMAKAMMGGAPARNGLSAALLAKTGFHGPPDIFEGRDGVLGAFSPNPDAGQLSVDLGGRYEIMRTSLKKHACGGPIQGSVDGLLEIMDAEGLSAEDIAAVRVQTSPSGRRIVDGRSDPPINLQWVLAIAAVDRVVGVVQVHSRERLEDPAVLALKDRIEYTDDPEFEKVWPGQRPARVQVETTAGQSYTVLVEYPHGSPDRPLTWDEAEAKFNHLCADWDAAESVTERIRSLEEVPDVGELLTALAGARS